MRKYELSIASTYVPHWGIVEGVREIFQNAVDAQTNRPECEMYYRYENEILIIGNKDSSLEISSLLLGATSKHDSRFIGQHGEGYKIATMVLLRCGCKVTFCNNKKNEIWFTRLKNSKKYGNSLIPEFIVDTNMSTCNDDLIVMIEGIDESTFNLLQENNLLLDDDYKDSNKYDTQYGSVLLDDKYSGSIYVKGIFVCKNDTIHYGYDFKPEVIRLDRDRRLVSDFDLQYNSSKVISTVDDVDFIHNSLQYEDAKYLMNAFAYSGSRQKDNKIVLADKVADIFIEKNGKKAIPVTTNDEFNKIAESSTEVKPIMVTETEKSLIELSDKYEKPVDKNEDEDESASIFDRLQNWFEDEIKSMTSTAQDTIFYNLLSELRDKYE